MCVKTTFFYKKQKMGIQLYLKMVSGNTYLTVASHKVVLQEQFLDSTSGPLCAQSGDVSADPQGSPIWLFATVMIYL